MKYLLSAKVGKEILISGSVLTAATFISLIINVLDVYGKASKITSCPETSNCGLTFNLMISRIGFILLWVGLGLIAVGVTAIAVGQRDRK